MKLQKWCIFFKWVKCVFCSLILSQN